MFLSKPTGTAADQCIKQSIFLLITSEVYCDYLGVYLSLGLQTLDFSFENMAFTLWNGTFFFNCSVVRLVYLVGKGFHLVTILPYGGGHQKLHRMWSPSATVRSWDIAAFAYLQSTFIFCLRWLSYEILILKSIMIGPNNKLEKKGKKVSESAYI